MTKFLIAAAFIVAGVMTWTLPKNAPTTEPASNTPAMTVVIDADSGELRAPTKQERQTISKQRQDVVKTQPKVHYSDTMKVYADGTRTGVVDPMHTHRIYASIDEDGKVVVHETLTPIQHEEIGVAK